MLVKNCLGANGNDFWASTTYRYSLPKGRARKLVFFTPCMDAALCSLRCSYWRGLTVHGIYSISCGKETIDIFIKGGLFTAQAINDDLILYTDILTTSTGWSSAESRQTPLSCSCYSGYPSGTSLHHIYHSTGSSRNISQQSALTGKTRYRLQQQLSSLRHSPRSAAERKTGRY